LNLTIDTIIAKKQPLKYLNIFVILVLIYLSSCSVKPAKIVPEPIVSRECKINDRYKQLSKLVNIKMDGHINISQTHKNGNLFAKLEYNTIDSLQIQFKDLIGRKLAHLTMNNDHFHLWLQRKNEHMEGKKLPGNYSYLTIDNKLSVSEFRKILLGIPISDSYHQSLEDSVNNIITYKSARKLTARYKVDEKENYVEKITFYDSNKKVARVLYKEYKLNGNILLPSKLILENITNPVRIEINLSDFNFETLAKLNREVSVVTR